MEELIYTVKEAAQLLKVSPNAVYALIQKKELHALKLNGLKITRKELLDFIERQSK